MHICCQKCSKYAIRWYSNILRSKLEILKSLMKYLNFIGLLWRNMQGLIKVERILVNSQGSSMLISGASLVNWKRRQKMKKRRRPWSYHLFRESCAISSQKCLWATSQKKQWKRSFKFPLDKQMNALLLLKMTTFSLITLLPISLVWGVFSPSSSCRILRCWPYQSPIRCHFKAP